MNIRLEKECSQCWKYQNMIGDRSNCCGPRIVWDVVPGTRTIIRVSYRFLSDLYQKDYVEYGNSFSLYNLFDINGAVTGIAIIFQYVDEYFMLVTESQPFFLSELQLYTIRDIIGTGSYLYGEMSAY